MSEGSEESENSGTWFNWWPGPVVTSGRIVAAMLATLALLGFMLGVGFFLDGFALAGLVAALLAGLAGWAALSIWRSSP